MKALIGLFILGSMAGASYTGYILSSRSPVAAILGVLIDFVLVRTTLIMLMPMVFSKTLIAFCIKRIQITSFIVILGPALFSDAVKAVPGLYYSLFAILIALIPLNTFALVRHAQLRRGAFDTNPTGPISPQ